MRLKTGGGGGYGNPVQRDEEEALRDALNGYISLRAAEEDYGVVIDPVRFTIDRAATRKKRRAMTEMGAL